MRRIAEIQFASARRYAQKRNGTNLAGRVVLGVSRGVKGVYTLTILEVSALFRCVTTAAVRDRAGGTCLRW